MKQPAVRLIEYRRLICAICCFKILSEFSALLALSAVNKYLFDHRFAQIITDYHRLEAVIESF